MEDFLSSWHFSILAVLICPYSVSLPAVVILHGWQEGPTGGVHCPHLLLRHAVQGVAEGAGGVQEGLGASAGDRHGQDGLCNNRTCSSS